MTIESARVLEDQKALPAVQYLRGLAAVMVVASHCYIYVRNTTGANPLPWAPSYGFFGVAIFFIISGFIMYFTCRDKWVGGTAPAASFAARRLHRIVPLYWVVTAITLALILIAGADDSQNRLSWGEVILSLLFIPYGFDGVAFRPIVGVGWTLNFEMFFYALFAIGLLTPKRAGLPLVLALIVATIAIGQTGVLGRGWLGALAQPIVGLFGLGILLGWARDRVGRRIAHKDGVWILAALTAASPLVLAIAPEVRSQLWLNPTLWGFALIFVIVGVLTAGPANQSGPAARFGLALGGASYLLYLIHPLIIRVIEEVAQRLHLLSAPTAIAVACIMFATAIAVALIGHKRFEPFLNERSRPLFGLRRSSRSSTRNLADATL